MRMLTILTDVCSVCLSCSSACSVHRVPCARGHSVQSLSNYFDRLFYLYMHFINVLPLCVTVVQCIIVDTVHITVSLFFIFQI